MSNIVQRKKDLSRLESVINDNIDGFIEVAKALHEIHENKLYLLEFKNFTDYARETFGFGTSKVYKLIGSFKDAPKPVKIDKTLAPSASQLPNLTPEPEVKEPPEQPPEILVYKDRAGQQIQGEMAEMFLKYDNQIKVWDALIKDLNTTIKAEAHENDPVWAAFEVSHFKDYIANIKALIKFRRPWAQCPVCGGDGGVKGSCKTCKDPVTKKGRGWVIHNQWRMIPDEDK